MTGIKNVTVGSYQLIETIKMNHLKPAQLKNLLKKTVWTNHGTALIGRVYKVSYAIGLSLKRPDPLKAYPSSNQGRV